MLTHTQVWRGIDRLAQRASTSPSGLARMAGLDPTTFNPSKRAAASDSKPRWPSTESLAKALDATKVSFAEFAGLATDTMAGRSVPLIGLAQAGNEGFFDDAGFPVGSGWEEVIFSGLDDEACYALEISGDSMLPLYRPGDRIVVAPHAQPRRGDRVVAKLRSGEIMAKELGRTTARTIELVSLNTEFETRVLDVTELVWMARIVWASQ